jgi:hypothetical protein
MFSFLDGYKTYILGAVTVVIGIVELLGIDVIPGVDQAGAFNYILGGLALITGKSAIKKLEP